jgi:hypothetical protein
MMAKPSEWSLDNLPPYLVLAGKKLLILDPSQRSEAEIEVFVELTKQLPRVGPGESPYELPVHTSAAEARYYKRQQASAAREAELAREPKLLRRLRKVGRLLERELGAIGRILKVIGWAIILILVALLIHGVLGLGNNCSNSFGPFMCP